MADAKAAENREEAVDRRYHRPVSPGLEVVREEGLSGVAIALKLAEVQNLLKLEVADRVPVIDAEVDHEPCGVVCSHARLPLSL